MGLVQQRQLLAASEPDAVDIVNPEGRSPFVLTCEHAGRCVPQQLDNLGLPETQLKRHIAWDIGAEQAARHLATNLDATLVIQRYSRLVIDCNRPLFAKDAIPEQSDGTVIPGNVNLSIAQRDARIQAIYLPFQETVTATLDRRLHAGIRPVLIALHSFTPALAAKPAPRPWDLGLLYHRDDRLALLIDQVLDTMPHGLNITHNQPYSVDDQSDHTIPFHGESRKLRHILLEIRNDHISSQEGQVKWAEFLGNVFARVNSLPTTT